MSRNARPHAPQVLNAGVASGDAAKMWMSNQLGPFLLTSLLAPTLAATAAAFGGVRVCAVSSGAHKRASVAFDSPWASASPYGQSKLAQIMHMRELQRRLRRQPGLAGETAVRCIAATPGMAYTNIFAASVPVVLKPVVWFLARSAHVGAHVIKMALVDDEVPGGSYLSNCCIKPAEGAGDGANDPEQWAKLWALCEADLGEIEARFP